MWPSNEDGGRETGSTKWNLTLPHVRYAKIASCRSMCRSTNADACQQSRTLMFGAAGWWFDARGLRSCCSRRRPRKHTTDIRQTHARQECK